MKRTDVKCAAVMRRRRAYFAQTAVQTNEIPTLPNVIPFNLSSTDLEDKKSRNSPVRLNMQEMPGALREKALLDLVNGAWRLNFDDRGI